MKPSRIRRQSPESRAAPDGSDDRKAQTEDSPTRLSGETAREIRHAVIGYGKPPLHSRFVKGQSGNPKGRPKKAKVPAGPHPPHPDAIASAFHMQANQTIRVRKDGKTQTIPIAEAAVTKTIQAALGGSAAHARILFSFLTKYEEATAAARKAEYEIWATRKAEAEAAYRDAARRGLPEPVMVHPDDIRLHEDGSVEILGPVTLENILRARCVFDLQRYRLLSLAWQYRVRQRRRRSHPRCPTHGWMLIAELEFQIDQRQLPSRLRLSQQGIGAELVAYQNLSLRDLHARLRVEAEIFDLPVPPRDMRLPVAMPVEMIELAVEDGMSLDQMLSAYADTLKHTAWKMARMEEENRRQPG